MVHIRLSKAHRWLEEAIASSQQSGRTHTAFFKKESCTKETMKIRIASKNDAKEIANIIKRHFESDYMGMANFDEGYIKEKMKKDTFLVADSDSIIGCIRLSFVDIDLAEIRTLCVDKEYRGKGIAQSLLNEAVSFLKEKKMRKLIARMKSDNKDAITLFEKNGFKQEGYFLEHYRKGIDVLQFYKFL